MNTAATSLPERNAAEIAALVLTPEAVADSFCRYGGEEFLLLLPDTGGDAASRTLERFRRVVAELDWNEFSAGMHVTISAGVVTLRDNDTADTFLARADSALYSARAQGRNRIVTN